MFNLDSRLEQDTHLVGDFPLCRLLLSKDANYPWLILVPRRAEISEVFQLDDDDRAQLWVETDHLAQVLHQGFGADKMNVAALGNIVSQLHMHVIVRYKVDVAWPAPVWGKVAAVPYTPDHLARVLDQLKGSLGCNFVCAQGNS